VFSGEVINASGWLDQDKQGRRYRDYFPNASAYYVSNHAGERGLADAADLTDFTLDLSAPLPDELVEPFDVVLSHTTLEHISDAHTAFHTLCRMSREIVIVVVPFAQEMHATSSYGDYWRFTPMGLRELFQANGLSVVFEAASPFRNAGVYLVAVGSRDPNAWRERMPPWEPCDRVGEWIGRTWFSALRRLGMKSWRRLHGLIRAHPET